ncbi:hypothetical protein CN128_09905 [Sinorhizobium meliloti]|uniref:hypothetical protein n=1 Tax=Rhizobium meliloti TaxID=382 RepID=UPI000FDC3FD3|nr:hypothetical protein [Sinorhizobium meliloti]RVM58397.1 hypothetical protein CN128_09905 [Sinorhizobium meliloti]
MTDLVQQEAVTAARTSDEAKNLAKIGIACFLRRARLVPATEGQVDAIIPSYRNRDAEQDRLLWLRGTEWWAPLSPALHRMKPPELSSCRTSGRKKSKLSPCRALSACREFRRRFALCAGMEPGSFVELPDDFDIRSYDFSRATDVDIKRVMMPSWQDRVGPRHGTSQAVRTSPMNSSNVIR